MHNWNSFLGFDAHRSSYVGRLPVWILGALPPPVLYLCGFWELFPRRCLTCVDFGSSSPAGALPLWILGALSPPVPLCYAQLELFPRVRRSPEQLSPACALPLWILRALPPPVPYLCRFWELLTPLLCTIGALSSGSTLTRAFLLCTIGTLSSSSTLR